MRPPSATAIPTSKRMGDLPSTSFSVTPTSVRWMSGPSGFTPRSETLACRSVTATTLARNWNGCPSASASRAFPGDGARRGRREQEHEVERAVRFTAQVDGAAFDRQLGEGEQIRAEIVGPALEGDRLDAQRGFGRPGEARLQPLESDRDVARP